MPRVSKSLTGSVRAFVLFAGFLAACLLTSALLHYPLHLLFDGLIEVPAHKQVARVAKVLALPGFFVLVIRLGLFNRKALGFGVPRPVFLHGMFLGWLYGLLVMAVLSTSLIGLGARTIDPIGDGFLFGLAEALITGLIGGLLIALVEETFFRGAMFQAIRRSGSAFSAVVLTSLGYASLHFIDPLRHAGSIGWFSGFQILSGSFWRLGEWATFDAFISLVAVGIFLGVVRERTGSIAYCIGLHAGWVLIIRLTKWLTSVNHASDWNFLISAFDGITGYLAAAWLLISTLIYWLYARNGSSAVEKQAAS